MRKTHIEPVIRPAAKLHLAVLVVEGEPDDVYLARGHEDAGWDVGAEALMGHHHVRRICPVKRLTGAAIRSIFKMAIDSRSFNFSLFVQSDQHITRGK